MVKPSLPNIKARFTGLELAVVELLYKLADSTARRVKSGARYCFPGQQWIADRLGVSRRSINHVIRLLRLRGILQVIHRRKKEGHWQTNVYKVVDCRSWWKFWTIKALNPWSHREKETSHIEHSEKKIIDNSEGPPVAGSVSGVLADIIRDLEAKAPAFSLVK